jgi:hypothetical protein
MFRAASILADHTSREAKKYKSLKVAKAAGVRLWCCHDRSSAGVKVVRSNSSTPEYMVRGESGGVWERDGSWRKLGGCSSF